MDILNTTVHLKIVKMGNYMSYNFATIFKYFKENYGQLKLSLILSERLNGII